MLLIEEPLDHLNLDSLKRLEAALQLFAGATVAVSHNCYFETRFASIIREIHRYAVGKRALVATP